MSTEERLSMPLGEAMFSQRAIRRLKPDPIPEADLKTIMEATIRAPNGGNQQPWHFIVVQDPELRRELGVLYREAWWVKRRDQGIYGPEDIPPENRTSQSAMKLPDEIGQAPVMILICATAKGAGAMGSVIPSAQNMLLAARVLGIVLAAPSPRCTHKLRSACTRYLICRKRGKWCTACRLAIHVAILARYLASHSARCVRWTITAHRPPGPLKASNVPFLDRGTACCAPVVHTDFYVDNGE